MTAEPVVVQTDALPWSEMASGVRMAVLHGDPMQPGPFALRLEYPPGFRKEPHYHLDDAFITVLSGSYFRGYGNVFDESSAVELAPGSFSVNPVNVPHYEWAEQTATLQIHAVGPWKTVYVDVDGNPIEQPADSELTM